MEATINLTPTPTPTVTPEDVQAIQGTPVYYATNLHAGKEFYLNTVLRIIIRLTFSDDFADIMDQIESEYMVKKLLTDVSDTTGVCDHLRRFSSGTQLAGHSCRVYL